MIASTPHILIAEDEPKVAALLADYLLANGFSVDVVVRGDAVIPAVQAKAADIILLDVRLPGKDGFSVLRELAVQDSPALPGVIVISALAEEIDRLLGLELGADDYICKPFSPREVVARIKALLRRRHLAHAPAAIREKSLFSQEENSPHLVLEEERLQCRIANQVITLTVVEFRLLQALMSRPGCIMSREQLMRHLYTDHRIVADRTIDSHVKKIRRKLESVVPDWEFIAGVYGAGFRYEPVMKCPPLNAGV
jgi:two-component system response regulator BaeR